MLPTQLLWLCNQIAHAFQVPALCKVRKGRGTHYLFGASEIKSLGHPPEHNRFLKITVATNVKAISEIARTQSGGSWLAGKVILDIATAGITVQ